MNLFELARQHPVTASNAVPHWMTGCFRRHSISFADGTTDTETRVFWVQSRGLTIDLRLPSREQPLPAKAYGDYQADELRLLANCEGWVADSRFEANLLDWSNFSSLQSHNRWQEPAELRRVGNAMLEFAPSGAYVEDWRLQPSATGDLIGLRLIEERSADGSLVHGGGGLIVCGDYAALVLDRPEPLLMTPEPNLFREQVLSSQGDATGLQQLLDFEVSLAAKSGDEYLVTDSNQPLRENTPLMDFEGFTLGQDDELIQELRVEGTQHRRLFRVDCLESDVEFPMETPMSDEAKIWMETESETLQRYARLLR